MNWIKTNEQALSEGSDSAERVVLEMRASENNEPPTFRGSTIFNSSLSRVAFVLIDIESKKKWVNRLADHHLIEGDIFGMEYSTYEYYNLAWPVADREYVIKAKWSIDKENKPVSAKLELASILHDDYPQRKDRVRGDLQDLVFYLKEISTEKTEVRVEIKVDPKGDLPAFLANIIQKNWPLTTLRALYKEVMSGSEKHKLFHD